MKINDLFEAAGNASVSGVLDIMASDRKPLSPDYCHYRVAQAIKSGKVNDNDYVLLLGDGKSVAHSIVASNDGDIKVDSYNQYYTGEDDGLFFYDIHGQDRGYKVVYSIPVGKFKQLYLND